MLAGMGEQAFYLKVGFDPNTLCKEEIALLVLMRRMKFGTIEALSVHAGKPGVVKSVVQRLELTNDREAAAIIGGKADLISNIAQE